MNLLFNTIAISSKPDVRSLNVSSQNGEINGLKKSHFDNGSDLRHNQRQCTTTVLGSEKKATKISIQPNPAHDTINFVTELNIVEVQIYSMYGFLVKVVTVNSSSERIRVRDLKLGYYSVVAITDCGGCYTTTFMKH